MAGAGYSGRPLWAKLGIKEGMVVSLKDAPDGFLEWLGEGLPSCDLGGEWGSDWEFGVAFLLTREDLEAVVSELVDGVRPDGVLWVSWPKKSSSIETELAFDVVQERLLETGLVDTKVCAVSEDWSGLKFMVRKELRKGWPGNRLDR